MTRRDVGLAVLVGVIAGIFVAFSGFGASSVPGRLVGFAYAYWYVGVVLLLVGALFAWRHLPAKVPRILGVTGLGWVAMIMAYPVVWLIGLMLTGPLGP